MEEQEYDEFDPMAFEPYDNGELSTTPCPECGEPLYIYYFGHMAHGDDYYTVAKCRNCDYEIQD